MSCQRNVKAKGIHQSRYINLFIGCKCAPDLLQHNLFPNAKEITESFAMFDATKHLDRGFEWNLPHITVVVVGDGHKPRTGAMFAHRTSWNAISVDPELANIHYPFKRFEAIKARIENHKITADGPVVIVLPHSHAKIADCLDNIRSMVGLRAVITMDCCIKNPIPGREPDVSYADPDVWSPMNVIRVWRHV